MTWSELGRYDVIDPEHMNLPYELVLTVSDMLEREKTGS
jgi:hypothetical protein